MKSAQKDVLKKREKRRREVEKMIGVKRCPGRETPPSPVKDDMQGGLQIGESAGGDLGFPEYNVPHNMERNETRTSKVKVIAGREKPWEAEVEMFLAAVEKEAAERFCKKYNYDLVKDEPLVGRYEWVPLS